MSKSRTFSGTTATGVACSLTFTGNDNLVVTNDTVNLNSMLPSSIVAKITGSGIESGEADCELYASPDEKLAVYSLNTVGWSSGQSKEVPRTSVFPLNLQTSKFFNSTNATQRIIELYFYTRRYGCEVNAWTYSTGSSWAMDEGYFTLGQTLTLDAPPTFDATSLSVDTSHIYAGLTTASITVSNLLARYGGNIEEVKFTIGNQTDRRVDEGELSILLDSVGTFTPTLTVTDSRGQVTTRTLEPITVDEISLTPRVKDNGTWRRGLVRVKVNGEWKECVQGYVKVNGEWKMLL